MFMYLWALGCCLEKEGKSKMFNKVCDTNWKFYLRGRLLRYQNRLSYKFVLPFASKDSSYVSDFTHSPHFHSSLWDLNFGKEGVILESRRSCAGWLELGSFRPVTIIRGTRGAGWGLKCCEIEVKQWLLKENYQKKLFIHNRVKVTWSHLPFEVALFLLWLLQLCLFRLFV